MKITKHRLTKLEIPFKSAFSHSLASRERMSALLLVLETADGICGYGEATPRAYVTGESLSESIEHLSSFLRERPTLSIRSLQDIEELLSDPALSNKPSSKAALELACLDALGKHEGKTAQQYFGPIRFDQLEYSAVVTSGELSRIREIALMSRHYGLKHVKLKFGTDLDTNLAIAQAVREILPEALLRADANACWSLQQAVDQIPTLAKQGILYFEQPLAAENRHDYITLKQELCGIAEIMVDESIVSKEDACWFIENQATDRALLKISKNGGILGTLELARLFADHHIPVHLGSHVGETSLLSAAARVAAAHFPFETLEGSFGTLLLERDITNDPLIFGPKGYAPAVYSSLPGLGIEVVED